MDVDCTKAPDQDPLVSTALDMIGKVARLPVIRVDREEFLRSTFSGSNYLEQIVERGPQSVYTVDSLRKKADELILKATKSTALASFASGLPSNPVLMVAAGGADVVQYFGFAINMAQQLAYLFGEDDLLAGDLDEVSEEAKVRIVGYLGVMFGAAGASSLVVSTSKTLGTNLGKKIAAQALTKTTWYPIFKKVAALVGQKVTKKTVEKTVTKAVPVVGGIVSGALTYATFKPMGSRLADVFAAGLKGVSIDEEMELVPEFASSLVDA